MGHAGDQYTETRLKGDALAKAGRWEEALAFYRQSREVNPGDTTSWREEIAASRGTVLCLRHLTLLLSTAFAELSPAVLRDPDGTDRLVESLRFNASRERLQTFQDLVDWLLSLEERELLDTIGPLVPKDRPLPSTSIRRFLLRFQASLTKAE